MRRLAQPSVVTAAAIAAAASAVASLPSILLWDKRPFPVWFPEMAIFFCGFVLRTFVFAWLTEYTRRPIFIFRIKPLLFKNTTNTNQNNTLAIHWLRDPALRLR